MSRHERESRRRRIGVERGWGSKEAKLTDLCAII